VLRRYLQSIYEEELQCRRNLVAVVLRRMRLESVMADRRERERRGVSLETHPFCAVKCPRLFRVGSSIFRKAVHRST
jgi:hypothetical protein